MKFGNHMSAGQLYDAQYGQRFRRLVDDARRRAHELGHNIPPPDEWDYDGREVQGRYAGECATCCHSVLVHLDQEDDNKAVTGVALTCSCPGKPWL